MSRLIGVMLLSVLTLLSRSAWAELPSVEQIIRWLPKDDVVEVENIYPLKIKGGEQAYLVSVTFPEGARNFWAGYVLARPELNEARVLESYGGQYNGIERGGESLALIGSSGSGQGHYQAEYSVVAFDGWQAHELYSIAVSDNSGNCGYEDKLCEGSEAFLHFVHIGGADSLRLSVTEVTYSSTGEDDAVARARTRSELVRIALPW